MTGGLKIPNRIGIFWEIIATMHNNEAGTDLAAVCIKYNVGYRLYYYHATFDGIMQYDICINSCTSPV